VKVQQETRERHVAQLHHGIAVAQRDGQIVNVLNIVVRTHGFSFSPTGARETKNRSVHCG
jgi:hypothetical protein